MLFEHLILPVDFRARFEIANQIKDKTLDICITEAEQVHVKDRIGNALYLDLIEYLQGTTDGKPKEYCALLNGGTYEVENCRNAEKRVFLGLITAVSYYAYARLIKTIDISVTRFGFTQKTDEYSSRPALNIKLAAEGDALAMADKYMNDCILFLSANREQIPLFNRAGAAKNRLSISVLKTF